MATLQEAMLQEALVQKALVQKAPPAKIRIPIKYNFLFARISPFR
jgi:hypothetical protein